MCIQVDVCVWTCSKERVCGLVATSTDVQVYIPSMQRSLSNQSILMEVALTPRTRNSTPFECLPFSTPNLLKQDSEKTIFLHEWTFIVNHQKRNIGKEKITPDVGAWLGAILSKRPCWGGAETRASFWGTYPPPVRGWSLAKSQTKQTCLHVTWWVAGR